MSAEFHRVVGVAFRVRRWPARSFAELAAALWRLAYREGWNVVSLRRVAVEAGLSLGSLQHYFTGIDDLLDYSVSGVLDILDERLGDQLTTLADPRNAESTVREVLQSMLPGVVIDPAAERQPDDSWVYR